MNIKVCGITQVKQLQQLDGLGIDFAGLIFVDGSPRNVAGKFEAEQLKDSDFRTDALAERKRFRFP